jgi:surfeit locus 1 family protein
MVPHMGAMRGCFSVVEDGPMGWVARVGLTVAAAAVIVTFLMLGRWQWTTAHEARFEEPRAGMNPVQKVVPLENYVPLDAIGSRVTVTGLRNSDMYRLIPSRSSAGASDDPTSCWRVEPVVLPSGAAVPVVIAAGPCAGLTGDVGQVDVALTGILQPSESRIDSTVGAPVLPSITTDVLIREWPYQLHDGYVVVDGITALRPNPPALGIDLRSGAYALQWWFFAAFAAVIWWRAIRPMTLDENLDVAPATVSGGPDPVEQEGQHP